MTDERPQEVAPGVQRFDARTPTLPPATSTNSYALGTRELLLVEPATPFDDEQRAWRQWAEGLVQAGRTLRAIFVTHHHPDHIGGAEVLSRGLGLPLWGHALTAELLPHLRFDRLLDDGDVIDLDGPEPQRWTCLHTPGHDRGHLCLEETTSRIQIVGDMVASTGTILIAPGDGDLRVYLEQLARLRDRGATMALPAHGAPIEDPAGKYQHYIDHRLMRQDKVVAVLGTEEVALSTLVQKVYDDVPPSVWPIAELSLHAHLLKLEAEGRAAHGDRGWKHSVEETL